MKKLTCTLLSVLLLFSLTFFGGCSDFSFNPIGEWEFAREIYYVSGKEQWRIEKEEMAYSSTKYIFEKSGTGYITVDGDRMIDFTYDYDDSELIMHMTQYTIGEESGSRTEELIDVKYAISSDDDGTDNRLIRTVEYTALDENEKEVPVKEEYILFRL